MAPWPGGASLLPVQLTGFSHNFVKFYQEELNPIFFQLSLNGKEMWDIFAVVYSVINYRELLNVDFFRAARILFISMLPQKMHKRLLKYALNELNV